MGVSITKELCVFFATVVSGILSGIFYDLFSIFRNGKTKGLFVSLSDILLSVVICSVIVIIFYSYNSFSLRWYMFIGLLLGIVFYFLCISKIFVFILEKIFELFDFILKILLTPTLFLYKILLTCLFKPIRAFISFLVKKILGMMNKLKINRGIRKNGNRKKKKHTKTKANTNNVDSYIVGTVNDYQGHNVSTTDN